MDSAIGTGTYRAAGPLPRGYMTPACRVGQQWSDLHAQCHAPGYRDRILGWVKVPCACGCHQPGTGETPA
ncbi:hypothetical protein [Streptacidiphilus sp. BW17]|uniref:hypothetical protein n=1 Tax=Streptacidiphilus sp. BW17 TaxID=3156274 RepID=UPI003511737A